MRSNDLQKEMRRLHREGLLNDEEAVELKKILSGGGFSGLAQKIVELQNQMRDLGAFDNSRELLECSDCGLFEDLTFEGMLVTNRRNHPEDTGLRFTDEQNGKFKCPHCGSLVSREDEEEADD